MNAALLLQALTDGAIRFIVVGGIAAFAQGVPVVTFDVDIVHERSLENVRRLLEVLSGMDAADVRAPGSSRIAPREDLINARRTSAHAPGRASRANTARKLPR